MRWWRILGIGLVGAVTVVALTWILEHVMEPPYSGYLALCVVGLAVTTIIRRQPGQRAAWWLRRYFRARARFDEAAARERILARFRDRPDVRGSAQAAWRGPSEKDRVLAGLAVMLTAEGRHLDPSALSVVYDGVRDKFSIPGWSALPVEFVGAVRDQLPERERHDLDALVEKYRLFQQRFFQRPSSLGIDPAASTLDFARLLASVGNRVAKIEPGDAERAYRLSLRLGPADNLAHAGLALLLERTGRHRDALTEARTALAVLDRLAERATERAPTMEDIYPFRSATQLRETLGRVARGESAGPP